MDTYAAAAPDVITAFAVPNPDSSSQSQSVFSGLVARQVTSPSGSPGLLQIGPLLFRSTLSAVDDCRLFLPNGECSDGDHNSHVVFVLVCGKHGTAVWAMPLQNSLMILLQSMVVGEAICILREVIAVANRPQDIEDDEAMAFFGGQEGDADESQG